MPIVDITNLPPAPSRQQSPEAFVAAADKHVASLTVMVQQLNQAFDGVEASESAAAGSAASALADRTAAQAARTAAQASAELAAGYAGAVVWSAATVYLADAVVFSPSNRMLYRRKAAGSSATDPAADAANWAPVTLAVGGNAVWHAGNFNPADKADLAGANFAALSVGGKAVWHAGNLNPASYAPLAGAAFTGAISAVGSVTASGLGGFVSATYAANVRNPIWRFGNSDQYGLSYFQGAAGESNQDVMGLHFGTATALGSQFRFRQDGTAVFSGDLYLKGYKAWHAGNVTPVSVSTELVNLNADSYGFSNVAGFSYANGAPYTGPLVSLGTYNYVLQLNATYGGGSDISFRTRNGDSNAWNPWRALWHSGNFNPGNYAPLTGATFTGSVNVVNGGVVTANRYTVKNANANDAISGTAPWYGLGYLDNLFVGGEFAVTLQGYNGVRIRSSGAILDLGPAAANLNVPLSVGRLASGWDSGVDGSISCANWFRSSNASGWYNATYAGGIYMEDATWVRTYGSKGLLVKSSVSSYGMLQLLGEGNGSQEVSMNFRDLSESPDAGWTMGRMSDRFFWYKAGVFRMALTNAGDLGAGGRLFGNDVNRAGNGLGRITVSTASPSGGAQGDIWVMY